MRGYIFPACFHSAECIVCVLLNEGYAVDDCYLVINEQVSNGLHNVQIEKYLRLLPLFHPANFESYLTMHCLKKRQVTINRSRLCFILMRVNRLMEKRIFAAKFLAVRFR
ncbi:conserved phage C-terminal domain-containing protein [Solibacillus silvestris]|uniref:conserved phage C-terminal domain-containing protein n=1 Tax=Solibacillus silvestris TaxID=76853 RepID=UPI003F80DD1F